MSIKPGFIIVGGLLLAGGWFGYNKFLSSPDTPASAPTQGLEVPAPPSTSNSSLPSAPPPPPVLSTDSVDVNQVVGLSISGSTSLANLADELVPYGVTYNAIGSSAGLEKLQDPSSGVTIAGVSRELTEAEKQAGLVSHAIGNDAIAFAVRKDSKAPESISYLNLPELFSGNITNWSELGGGDAPVNLVIRGEGGTYESVLSLLSLNSYGPGLFMVEDNTTKMLNSLEEDSIGFATSIQVCGQSQFRYLFVAGQDGVPLDVTDPNYWPQRQVFLVTKGNPTPQQQTLIDLSRQIYANKLTAQAQC